MCDGSRSCDVNEDEVSVTAIRALSHGARAVTVIGSLSASAHQGLFFIRSDNWNLPVQLGASQPPVATETEMQEVEEQHASVQRLVESNRAPTRPTLPTRRSYESVQNIVEKLVGVVTVTDTKGEIVGLGPSSVLLWKLGLVSGKKDVSEKL